jgi:transglutaminase-like putative cysteine protease
MNAIRTFVLAALILATGCSTESSGKGDGGNPKAGAPGSVIEESQPASAAATKSGVFEAKDVFTVKDIPEGTKKVRCWFEFPQEDSDQAIRDLHVDAPFPTSVRYDETFGTAYLYGEIENPKKSSYEVAVSFTVERREARKTVAGSTVTGLTEADRAVTASYLREEPYVVLNDKMKSVSAKAVGEESTEVGRARKIYDFVIANSEYYKKDPTHLKASGFGSAEYCLTCKTGNCTDFHALFMSLAREQEIPCRFLVGSVFKTENDGKDEDAGYHCWVQFFVPGTGWVPLDAAFADVMPDKQDYYFGSLDERRVAFSRGRNLDLAPKQDAGKVNYFIKMYAEADGKVHAGWTRKLTWREIR